MNAEFKEAERLEASFKDNEALSRYLNIVRLQPNNLPALCKASEMYSRLGKRQTAKEKQKQYYIAAKNFATRALRVNQNNAEANFVMAMAMGRMSQISSGEDKIRAVKDIRNYAQKCVDLDPTNYKGYHVLAKWNYEVSNLNAFERWLVKMAYGALPEASLQQAIAYYEKSKQLNPDFPLNYLELAKAYHRNGETRKAIGQLQILLSLPNIISDDEMVKAEGKKLLKEWQ